MIVTIKENFFDDIKNHIFNIFKEFKQEMANEDIVSLLLIYSNYVNRLVYKNPRKVFISNELKANPLYKNYKKILDIIVNGFEQGLNMNSYLSEKVVKHPTVSNPKSGTGDKDSFVNAYGIHHLHLGRKKENGNTRRTNDLLFVKICDNEIYFIDIIDHKKGFTKVGYLLEILHKNFPQLTPFSYPFPPIEPKNDFEEKEKLSLSKMGISLFHTIGNSTFIYPITKSGHSLEEKRSAENFCNTIIKLKKFMEENKEFYHNEIYKEKGIRYNTLELKAIFINFPYLNPLCIIEKNSSLVLYKMS